MPSQPPVKVCLRAPAQILLHPPALSRAQRQRVQAMTPTMPLLKFVPPFIIISFMVPVLVFCGTYVWLPGTSCWLDVRVILQIELHLQLCLFFL